MARSFNPVGGADYLQAEISILSSVPVTVFARFRKEDNASIFNDRVIWSHANGGSNNHNLHLIRRGNLAMFPETPRAAYWRSRDTANRVAATQVAALPNVWHTAAGIEAALDERHVLLNSANKRTNTGTADAFAVAHTRVTIGRSARSSPYGPWDGQIGWVGIWAAELSDQDIDTLDSDVFDPRRFRPDALVEIWPLNGTDPEIGILAGTHLTLFGTPTHVEGPPTSFFMSAA